MRNREGVVKHRWERERGRKNVGGRTARGWQRGEKERRGLCRACELSSGRRRHWKNRTEINRSVFFAELEHELSLSLVLSQFSQLSSLSSSFRRPTRFTSFYRPTSDLPSFFPPSRPFSFSSTSLFFCLCFSYLSWLCSSLQALGVYSVIARPSRTTALDFRRRSLEFHLIPPFLRSISFRTTSWLCLPSSYACIAYSTLFWINCMILLTFHYYTNYVCLLTFITVQMFSFFN